MRARAVNPRRKHEMTRPEKKWLEHLSDPASGYTEVRYEAMTLRIGDTRYTPDFSAVRASDGQLCLFEVKAALARAAFTDYSKLKLNLFAGHYQELVFILAIPEKDGGWHVREITGRE